MTSVFAKIIGRIRKEIVNHPNYNEILSRLSSDYPVISCERVAGYREEYTGYMTVHYYKCEERILSLGSVLFPNTIQTGMTDLG